MARERDEGKRRAILLAAKRLFAERGFLGTSVADMAGAVGLPVGSIYTYFENKEEVLKTIVEEGWDEFFGGLTSGFAEVEGPDAKLRLIVDIFLPSLLGDVDFISILLFEAGRTGEGMGGRFQEKLAKLASLIAELVAELAASRGIAMEFDDRSAMTAIGIFFLGSLDTVRIARAAGLPIASEDVVRFIRFLVENAFSLKLEPPPGSPASLA